MSRLRVAHLITQLELGGAQENTLYTVQHLDRARFEPILVAGPGGQLDERARALGDVPFHSMASLARPVRPHRDLAALAQLARLLRRLRPHLVHTHSSKAGILGRWAAVLAGVPLRVHSVHGFGFHAAGRSPMRRALIAAERLTAPITTHWIVVSQANLQQGTKLGLLNPQRTTLIRSGIELGRFRAAAGSGGRLRRELGLEPQQPLVVAIACFKPQKAPVDLVEVAARVARQAPEARFALAGDGELRGAIEAAIRRNRLQGRFHLLGWRQDVPVLLAAADLLLHTARWEGLPRVIPEAMAAGRPVVAGDADGIREVVAEGITGYLRPAGDLDGLAGRVLDLLADPGLRARMGGEGRRRTGEFDIQDMVRRQEALYDRLAGLAGGARVPAHGGAASSCKTA
ncbi:MAG: glycosyltransferase [Acidobacteriota bacterium]